MVVKTLYKRRLPNLTDASVIAYESEFSVDWDAMVDNMKDKWDDFWEDGKIEVASIKLGDARLKVELSGGISWGHDDGTAADSTHTSLNFGAGTITYSCPIDTTGSLLCGEDNNCCNSK